MKLYWIHPDRDETLVFDLPDGAVRLQLGARCCEGSGWRGIVEVDRVAKTFSCAEYVTGPTVKHTNWPRLRYKMAREDDGSYVAHVNEGDAPSFIVRPVAVTPGTVRA